MPLTESVDGDLSYFKQKLEDDPAMLHLRLMKAALKQATIPLLGIAEPTISARGTRRLHEENPYSADPVQVHKRTVESIVMEHCDFTLAQRETPGHHDQVELPRMVQYDLYHAAEGMPESRTGAPYDDLHSFFYQQEAVDTLLDHCQYFIDRQAFVMLMWHTYSPVWGNWNFYQITGQSGMDAPVVLDNSMHNPFGMLKSEDSTSRHEQQAIFKRVIDGFWSMASKDEKALAYRKKLDHIADFAKALAHRKGSAIFRPYHEHTPDGYFWWTLKNLSDDLQKAEQLYRKLFHKTRAYLEEQGVHNFLYAYSPDLPYQKAFVDKAAFLAHYRCGLPDLATVDVLGIDAYLWKQFTPEDQQDYVEASSLPVGSDRTAACHSILARSWERILQMMAWLREEYPDKIVGLTETGWDYSKWGPLGHKPITTFWQKVGMDRVQQMPEKQRPHFICFWRNDSSSSFYPYAGQSAVFSEEVIAISQILDTQVEDLPGAVV
jgi:hypothetical protein